MNLHNDTETFKTAVQETSDYFEIRDYLIEKDYWITFVLLEHDKAIFDDPVGWRTKKYQDSPIVIDFDKLWKNLKLVYTSELEKMAFKEIPNENNIKKSFKALIAKLKES